jgi:hypothetical protein
MSERRSLYTYTVTPQGVVARISTEDGDELRFQALISKSDGCSVVQEMLVRANAAHPTLVDDVQTALRRLPRLRMVLEFHRTPDMTGEHPRIRNVAHVESIFGSKPVQHEGQMDLFA